MPLVALLWLALLQALSLAAPPRSARFGEAGARGRVEQAARQGRRVAIPRPEAPVEALPAGASVATTGIARAGGPPPVGGTAPVAVLPTPPCAGIAAAVARRTLRRHGAVSHAVAARGGVLPYFPTAPPLQG